MAVVGIIAVLAGVAVPAYSALRARVANDTALSDVLNTGKALYGLNGSETFAITVNGPGIIPGLPGPRVSRGTQLFVRRWWSGSGYTAYVRGTNQRGSVTYYFEDGALSADGTPL